MYYTDLLTYRPEVDETDYGMHIKTNLFTRFLFLGAYSYCVNINSVSRIITFTKRFLWVFICREIISFDDVSHIEYTYKFTSTEFVNITFFSHFAAINGIDSFSISIKTTADDTLPVCAYSGESTESADSFVDSFIDFVGTQEEESYTIAEHIADIIGVSVGRSLSSYSCMITCPSCGRTLSNFTKRCYYCGFKTANPRKRRRRRKKRTKNT